MRQGHPQPCPGQLVPVAPASTPNAPAVSGPSASGRDSGYELVPAQQARKAMPQQPIMPLVMIGLSLIVLIGGGVIIRLRHVGPLPLNS